MDYFDNYFFSSKVTGLSCPAMRSLECKPPNACARDPSTGKEYCCDHGDVCWTIPSDCAKDGSTINCGVVDHAWCCLDKTEVCPAASGRFNICWSSAHDTLTNISASVLNDTYSSLSSASPDATSWSFTPATLIALTQDVPEATTIFSIPTQSTSGASHSSSMSSSLGLANTSSSMPPVNTSSSVPLDKPVSSKGMSGVGIAMAATGVIAASAILGVGLLFFLARRRNQKKVLEPYVAHDVDDKATSRQRPKTVVGGELDGGPRLYELAVTTVGSGDDERRN